MMRPGILIVAWSLTLVAGSRSAPPELFDIPPRDGANIEARHFEGVLPTSLLGIKGGTSQLGVLDIHYEKGATRIGVGLGTADARYLKIPIRGDFAFTRADYAFEGNRLKNIKIYGGKPLPSRGRVQRCYDSLVEILGDSGEVYCLQGDNEKPEWLGVVWKRPTGAVCMVIGNRYRKFSIELRYDPGGYTKYPLPWSPDAVERILRGEKSVGEILKRIDYLPAGDGGYPTIAPAVGEAAQLAQLNEAMESREKPAWEKQYQALAGKLGSLLAERYKGQDPGSVYKRLLAITKGDVAGFTANETRFGAADYLASVEDTKVIPFLFDGIRSERAEVQLACTKGIAMRCKGAVLNRAV